MFKLPPFIVSDGKSWTTRLLRNHILCVLCNISNDFVLPFDKVVNCLLFNLRIPRFDRHEPCVSSLGMKEIRANPIFCLNDYNTFVPR